MDIGGDKIEVSHPYLSFDDACIGYEKPRFDLVMNNALMHKQINAKKEHNLVGIAQLCVRQSHRLMFTNK